MKASLFAVLLGVLLTTGGCNTYRAYPGKRLPKSQVALIEVPPTVKAVNGEPVEMNDVYRLELLPGEYAIEWRHTYPNGFGETRQLSFEARADHRYELDQKFFAAPNPNGVLGALANLLIDTALMPFMLIAPPPLPTRPPEGEYYMWIVDAETEEILAGLPPDVPVGHQIITFVPVE